MSCVSHGWLARWRKWRACDVGEGTEGLKNELWRRWSRAHSSTFPSLHLRHSSFSDPSVTLPTSQLILQPFRCFTYVTVHSPTLLSLLLRHRFFTDVIWRAAHDVSLDFANKNRERKSSWFWQSMPLSLCHNNDLISKPSEAQDIPALGLELISSHCMQQFTCLWRRK